VRRSGARIDWLVNYEASEHSITTPVSLARTEQQRLARLAREADCSIKELMRDVLRDGFDYTEYRIRAVNEGLADLAAGRMMSLDELKARIAHRGADRAPGSPQSRLALPGASSRTWSASRPGVNAHYRATRFS
jgi:predicted transcriptional regulator